MYCNPGLQQVYSGGSPTYEQMQKRIRLPNLCAMKEGILLTFLFAFASLGNGYYIHVDPEVVKISRIRFANIDSSIVNCHCLYVFKIIILYYILLFTIHYLTILNLLDIWRAGTGDVPNI